MDSDTSYLVHVDMDAFFARVEKRDNPELREKPVIVGGLGDRGVVSTACYRAREYDVHSAMPMATARERCPHAEFLSPSTDRYRAASSTVREICRGITPRVKPLSLDEAYLDVTGVLHHYDSVRDIGRRLKQEILDATDLTASVGMGPNKMIAKLASDFEKPDGLTVVTEAEKREFVGQFDVGDLPGIGPTTAGSIREEGIETVADLQALSPEELTDRFGQRGRVYHRKAQGNGSSTLVLGEEQKSISNEETYAENLTDPDELLDRLHALTTKVSRRLREKGLEARTIVLKERRGDFTTLTRQRSLGEYVRSTETIWEWVERIFEDIAVDDRGIRLQGVGLKNLRTKSVQGELFEDTETKRDDLNELVDEINREMGDESIIRGRDLSGES